MGQGSASSLPGLVLNFPSVGRGIALRRPAWAAAELPSGSVPAERPAGLSIGLYKQYFGEQFQVHKKNK